jgi:hypothetical protein
MNTSKQLFPLIFFYHVSQFSKLKESSLQRIYRQNQTETTNDYGLQRRDYNE